MFIFKLNYRTKMPRISRHFFNFMRYTFYFLFLFFTGSIFAQSFISGKVIDGDFNEPLPFANITLKSNDNITNIGGTTTDFDGNFSFEVTPG